MDQFKRKVPTGIRPIPGHVPSTVFNQESSHNENDDKPSATNYVEELKSQKMAQSRIRNEEKRKDLEMLNNYNPWGKPGGGAPRQTGLTMMNFEKSLNDSTQAAGSMVDYLSKPGGGAPLRTESGNPIGVIKVHPDIRNNREDMNEECKKKARSASPHQVANGEQRYPKSQILGGREKTSDEIKHNLKERLDKQVDEKRASFQNDNSTLVSDDFMMSGLKVGYIKRDLSGKITRDSPLTHRGPDGVREYYDTDGDKGIVEQLGKPGPGVAHRTESGNVQSQRRGFATNSDDPFRPGRIISPAHQVFPVGIEDEAAERAWKRHPDLSPPNNKHTVENGYYVSDRQRSKSEQHNGTSNAEPVAQNKPLGTVYSAIMRTKGNYLDDLRQQISEKQVLKQKEKEKSYSDDVNHMRCSDIFGRPGNGAPRLSGGSLCTTRTKLDELETVSDGIRNPGAFRGLHN